MELTQVKTLIGVDDERIDIIYERTQERMLDILNKHLEDVVVIPDELAYIVGEVTISRFNRIGSEGMTSESIDGHRAEYIRVDLDDYENEIMSYIYRQNGNNSRGRVRFL